MLEAVKKAIEWVCDDYDIKPVEFQRLLEKIETALADKKRL
jgi:response regulator of citrate/malate metabolism